MSSDDLRPAPRPRPMKKRARKANPDGKAMRPAAGNNSSASNNSSKGRKAACRNANRRCARSCNS